MGMNVRKFQTFEWVDYENPKKSELAELIKPFGIDYHVLEDTLQVGHLPKIEKLNNLNFIILRAYSVSPEKQSSTISDLTNKIGFFYNDSTLITIHQKGFKFLENIGDDIEDPESLMIKIVERMLETYEKPTEWLSDLMDKFEKDVFLHKLQKFSVHDLYYGKAKARVCKKLLLLTQTVLNQVQVHPDNVTKLQDEKETLYNLIHQLDEFLEDANSLLNIYISTTSQKTNEVMKLLTIFSAFFLPLTFIVGVYGMNFQHMPELSNPYGYYYTILTMILISVLIFVWFKRKRII
ncbi:magnesium transporter [Algoriphagus boseongensis]|uniref:Magnesium transporter n=2 Tax=Algoriphagus boseongensis TaxID=1442587 RepID=A0A4R6TA93_9BACT|nr:magnesium transporter [Algoriphagus boseongensis]